VEYHGGRLWLDTTRGDAPGAVFRWTLPERQGQTPERTMGDAAPEGPDNTDSADHTDHTDATSDSQNGDATVARAREDRGRTADDATV
jgi:hypothetical protein